MADTPPVSLTSVYAARLREMWEPLQRESEMSMLEFMLRHLAKWRSQVLARNHVAIHGTTVMQGPFAGMSYVSQSTEGALIARLVGCYEAELHPHIDAIVNEGLDCVIDVGCAEGYYAVGLARRYPTLEVHARDISERAREACTELATRNGVLSRVIVGGEFRPQDFEAFAGRRVLVMVDAEGAELDVLQPELGPALAGMKLIVETHDGLRPGALKTLMERFGATHDIIRVDQGPKSFELPPWLRKLSHLDQVLVEWEWRAQPTPWLVMRPKAG